jgi:hypothetical protein
MGSLVISEIKDKNKKSMIKIFIMMLSIIFNIIFLFVSNNKFSKYYYSQQFKDLRDRDNEFNQLVENLKDASTQNTYVSAKHKLKYFLTNQNDGSNVGQILKNIEQMIGTQIPQNQNKQKNTLNNNNDDDYNQYQEYDEDYTSMTNPFEVTRAKKFKIFQ